MSPDDLKDTAVYQSLFKNASSVMMIVDPETGRILDANGAALFFYGFTENEIIGMDISNINLLSKNQIKKEMKNASDKKRKYFNFRHRLKNGTIKDVEVYTGPIDFHKKKVLYSIIHDISEKTDVQKALLENEQAFKAMINATQSLVYLADLDGNIINSNESGARLFKKEPAEVMGKNINIFFKENDVSRLNMIAQKVVQSHEPIKYQKKRDDRFYDVNFYPVFNSQNQVDKICIFANDITDLKKTEQLLAAIETAGGICHEMNQPLQVLLGNLEILKMNIREEDPNTGIINLLIKQTEKMGDITKKLTNITHYETKQYIQGTIFDIDRSSPLK